MQDMSHQIRTPLNIVHGFSQVLREDCEMIPDDEKRQIAETMFVQTNMLDYMVSKLLTASFIESRQTISTTDTVGCNDVAREAISYIGLHYPKISIELRSEVADDFYIQTSRLYLMRSLREILYNAAKYSDGQNIVVCNTRTPHTVRIIVEDTGPGIAAEDAPRLFEMFTKVNDLSEGLGLGLALAKRHLTNFGGDLILDTSYRGGCRFIIELPIEE
jgi:signal transduction histidine kinase